MVYRIFETRKQGNYEREISHYNYFTNLSGNPTLKSKEDLWRQVQSTFKSDEFYSCNLKLGTVVPCEWRQIEGGQPFLQSDPNGSKKDNLLELPEC